MTLANSRIRKELPRPCGVNLIQAVDPVILPNGNEMFFGNSKSGKSTTRSVSHNRTWLCIALVAILFSALTTTKASAQRPGANGEQGVAGDPGTNGGGGENGANVLSAYDIFRLGVGTRGGYGGNGGQGFDRGDEDSDAIGGNAGNGGNGGDGTTIASAFDVTTFRTFAFSKGGDGGYAGMFGRGTAPMLDGRGGLAGNGGNAHSEIADVFNDARVVAYGGDGGNAYGILGRAGNGGFTTVRASVDVGSDYPQIELRQYGGDGGVGYLGAYGGNGAGVSYGLGNSGFFAPGDPNSVFSRSLGLRGVAGNGGHSYNGVAGIAGSAVVDMLGVRDSLPPIDGSATALTINLSGGAGGKGYAHGSQLQSVAGADGGSARMINASEFGGQNARYELAFSLAGGNGGSAHGDNNSGNGGGGGEVSMAPISFDVSDESAINPVDGSFGIVNVNLNGGHGGNSFGSGTGGQGAFVSFDNAISLTANTRFSTVQVKAIGGAGGWGRTNNGNGGDAVVEINEAIDFKGPSIPYVLDPIKATAFGGSAGLGKQATNLADGGDASATAIQSDFYNPRTIANAVGGVAFGGKNGNANAVAEAHSTGFPSLVNHREDFVTSATAIANPAIHNYVVNRPSHGTESTARAVATTNAGFTTTAVANAAGGWGSVQSGSAYAQSTALNFGSGIGTASSHSTTYADRDKATDNNARSVAFSSGKSMTKDSVSRATARSYGHFTSSHGWASGNGYRFNNLAQATTSTDSWQHFSQAKSQLLVNGTAVGQESLSGSSAFSSFRQFGIAPTEGYASFAHAMVIPDSVFAGMALTSSGFSDVFESPADVLAIGSIGGDGSTMDADGVNFAISNSFDLQLSVQDSYNDQNLMVGFYNARSTGIGFDELSFELMLENEVVVAATFSSLFDANRFFENALFDLGDIGVDPFFLELDMNMTLSGVDDSFAVDFLYGNGSRSVGSTFGGGLSSVPEPSCVMLLACGSLAFISRRRRSL